jgi:hypothetical protein
MHVHAGQVAQHHAAVVGGGEVRVGGGQLVGPGDDREPETLRGLAAPQRLPARHRVHHPVGRDHHGVRRRHRHPGRVMLAQRRHAVRDDPLIHQGPRRVMQEHPLVIAAPSNRGQGRPRRIRARHSARDDPGDLRKPALGQRVPDPLDVPGGHHDQDLVHPGRLLERGHAVLHQRLAAQPQQLLGQRRADPLTDAAAQHHRDHPHEPDSNPPPAAVFTPAKVGKPLDSLGVFLRGGGRTAGYIE